MALRARLRQRLASDARRLAGALWRLADEADPARPTARSVGGGPPEHWLAVVRARAPQLLTGRGIGARIEERMVVVPEPAVPQSPDAAASGRTHPDSAAVSDAVIPPRRRVEWPSPVRRDVGPPAFPTVDRPAGPDGRWPAIDLADAALPRWPTLPSPSGDRPDWPANASSDRSGSSSASGASGASAAVAPPPATAEVRSPADPRPVEAAGRWPSPPGQPASAEPAFPAGAPTTGARSWVDPHQRPPAQAVRHVPAPASVMPLPDARWHDGGVRGRWPALPDAADQRVPAPPLDHADAERAQRLDAEQRGGG